MLTTNSCIYIVYIADDFSLSALAHLEVGPGLSIFDSLAAPLKQDRGMFASVFQRWDNNRGAQPTTWKELLGFLRDSDMDDVAKSIEDLFTGKATVPVSIASMLTFVCKD